MGLRDATDREIFNAARDRGAVIMTKDSDFGKLQDQYGGIITGSVNWRSMNRGRRKIDLSKPNGLYPDVHGLESNNPSFLIPQEVNQSASAEESISEGGLYIEYVHQQ